MVSADDLTRLAAKLEVSALVRQVEAAGGFAVVAARGEPESGSILVLLVENGANPRVYERLPDRSWHLTREGDAAADYLARRRTGDSDLWIVELDIANGERFVGLGAGMG